jgi:uncharacterized protein
MQLETKLLALDNVSLKMTGEGMAFAGYASVYGGVDAYGDTIDAKAYDSTINRKANDRPIRMRWNHHGPVIGKWLRIVSDEKGLWVEGELTPGHSVAQDVYASMKHGAVDGMSIGYFPKKVEMLQDGKRLLKEIELVEISVVEDPADLGAKINDVKSILDECHSIKEIESFLREVGGFSKTDSIALIARLKRMALGEHEAEMKAKQEIARLFQITL